jgi:hypothetical protein
MNHTPLSSSNLSSIAHDGKNLEVRFQSGKTYQFQNVPRDIYRKVIAHPSPGTAFHQLVKGQYPHVKIP